MFLSDDFSTLVPALMASAVVYTPNIVAKMLRNHNILTSEDYNSAEAKFEELNQINQAAVLVEVVHNRLAKSPEVLDDLRKFLFTLMFPQKQQQKSQGQ